MFIVFVLIYYTVKTSIKGLINFIYKLMIDEGLENLHTCNGVGPRYSYKNVKFGLILQIQLLFMQNRGIYYYENVTNVIVLTKATKCIHFCVFNRRCSRKCSSRTTLQNKPSWLKSSCTFISLELLPLMKLKYIEIALI